jgi:hypothetical protein
MTIQLMRNSELNTLRQEPLLDGEASGVLEQVHLVSLADFCRKEGITRIDLLKMDAQGYELNILAGAGNTLGQVLFILTEVGLQDKRADVVPFGQMQDVLQARGFSFCGLYEQYRYGNGKILVGFANALYLNMRLLET